MKLKQRALQERCKALVFAVVFTLVFAVACEVPRLTQRSNAVMRLCLRRRVRAQRIL